jgi:hypothetical protein
MKKIYIFPVLIALFVIIIVASAINNECNENSTPAWNENPYCARCSESIIEEVAPDYDEMSYEEKLKMLPEMQERLRQYSQDKAEAEKNLPDVYKKGAELAKRKRGWSQFTPENPVTVPKTHNHYEE